jgi:hypothetical protein
MKLISTINKSKLILFLQALVISVLLAPTPAYAYVDPGSGSVIVTTVLGFISAIAYTFRKYFYTLKRSFFGGKSGDHKRNKGSE